MSKKPNISKEAQVLLKLLRIALGTEPRKFFGEVVEPFPEGIDWKEVVRLSYEHKVSALAVDGLQSSQYDPYEGLDDKQTEELKAVLVPWIKDVENTEWSYCYYVEVLKTLCQIFRDNGLTPIILKGYGLSLNYPRPSHRGAGDIDVYLLDEDGNCAAERGDEILTNQLGLVSMKPERNDEHHSVFTFKGITIENHHTLVSTSFTKPSDGHLRRVLGELITEGYMAAGEDSPICLPSATFNAVLLIHHMYHHFSMGEISLRQLTDYVLFLKKHAINVKWERVDEIMQNSGLMEFSRGISLLHAKYLMVSSHINDITEKDNEFCLHLVEDVFRDIQVTGVRNIAHYYKNRWKIKYLSGKHWIWPTLMSIWIHLFLRKKYYLNGI